MSYDHLCLLKLLMTVICFLPVYVTGNLVGRYNGTLYRIVASANWFFAIAVCAGVIFVLWR